MHYCILRTACSSKQPGHAAMLSSPPCRVHDVHVAGNHLLDVLPDRIRTAAAAISPAGRQVGGQQVVMVHGSTDTVSDLVHRLLHGMQVPGWPKQRHCLNPGALSTPEAPSHTRLCTQLTS